MIPRNTERVRWNVCVNTRFLCCVICVSQSQNCILPQGPRNGNELSNNWSGVLWYHRPEAVKKVLAFQFHFHPVVMVKIPVYLSALSFSWFMAPHHLNFSIAVRKFTMGRTPSRLIFRVILKVSMWSAKMQLYANWRILEMMRQCKIWLMYPQRNTSWKVRQTGLFLGTKQRENICRWCVLLIFFLCWLSADILEATYDSSVKCEKDKSQKVKTIITFHCASKEEPPVLVYTSAHCHYLFDWYTPNACVRPDR